MSDWQATRTFRVVLSDGTVWSESSIEREVREELARIRKQAVTVYPPSGEKTYGPDPSARLEQFWERYESEWRTVGAEVNR